MANNLPANPEDIGSVGFDPCVVKIPCVVEGKDNSLKYSCLENPTDRGAWWATVPVVAGLNTTEHTRRHKVT